MRHQVRQEGNILMVELSGRPTEERMHALISDLLKTVDRGVRGTLVELRAIRSMGPVAAKSLVTSLPQRGVPRDHRIALLLMDESPGVDARFAETVAVNRGIAMSVFEDRDCALRWLAG
jgi:hypothetical protein